jgi:hypothetical protein
LIGGKRCGRIAKMKRMVAPLVFATLAGLIVLGHRGAFEVARFSIERLLALSGLRRFLDSLP